MYGDKGWYCYKPGKWLIGSQDIYYMTMKPSDRARMPDNPWISYTEGKNPNYPTTALRTALERIRNAHAALLSDQTTPDTRFADTVMDQNPASVTALIELMEGGIHIGRPGWSRYSPGVGGALQFTRFRYFDPIARRPGVPQDVAALVETLTADGATLSLVNLNQTEPRTVTIQGGAYGEHQIVGVSDGTVSRPVGQRFFTVRLAPGAGTRLSVRMQRYANPPTLDFPWAPPAAVDGTRRAASRCNPLNKRRAPIGSPGSGSRCPLPLKAPISDAKVLTGRQKPMTEVAFLFAEIDTEDGHQRHRASAIPSAPAARALRPRQGDRARSCIGEDPSDIARALGQAGLGRRLGRPQRPGHPGHRRLRHRAVGPQGASAPACRWPSCSAPTATRCRCYNTSGGFLHDPDRAGHGERDGLARARASAASRSRSASPTRDADLAASPRCASTRRRVPLMVDANQQWDRPTALRDGPRPGGVRPGLDRGAARRLRRRGPRRARRRARHADRHRRDADQRRRALRADRASARSTSSSPTPRASAASRQFLQLAALAEQAELDARAALRDGDPPPPRRRLPASSPGSSTSTGSTRCSTSGSRSATAACLCRTGRASAYAERAGPRLDGRAVPNSLVAIRMTGGRQRQFP